MKKKIPLILFFIAITLPSYSQNWSYDTLSEKKIEMNVAVIGNKFFFHSGAKKIGSSTVRVDKIDVFDVDNGTRETFLLPVGSPGRTLGATAVMGSKVLFAGGSTGDACNWVDIYDTLTEMWTTTTLSLDRYYLAGTAANNKAFFGGGYSSSIDNVTNKMDIYNSSTGVWTSTFFPSFGGRNLTAASIGNKVLFAGGKSNGANNCRDQVYIYNASTNQWLPTATLSQPKHELTSLVYDNKVYFIGGTAWNQSTNTLFPSDTIDIYDNVTGNWSTMKIPRLMRAHYDGAKRAYIKSAQAGCKMFLVPYFDANGGSGGLVPGNGDTIAVYDFARDSWSYLPLPHPRTHISIAAAKNKVYFAGGRSISYATDGQFFNHIDILTLEPKLQLAVNSTPSTQYDFGAIVLGEQETINVDFSNEGDYDLLFAEIPTRITITGDVGDFTIDPGLLESTDTLSPAEIISLPVTFSPTATGIRQITISVYSNDPDNPIYTFTVQGTGDEATAVNDPTFSKNIKIYPNPTTGLIKIESKIQEPLYVQVVNIQGTPMKAGEFLNSNNAVDISSFPEGLYFLKISSDQSSAVVKVVKK